MKIKKGIIIALSSIFAVSIFGCQKGHTHNYVFVEATESNCTFHGYSIDHYECSKCGKFFDMNKNEISKESIELPLGDHIYQYRVEKQYHVKYCEICNHVEESKSHLYNQEISEYRFIKDDATCVEHATYYKSCICGKSSHGTVYEDYFIDEDGEFGDHSYVFHEEIPAVNEDDGTGEYYSCSYCDLIFDMNKTVIDEIPVIPANAKITITNKYNGSEIDILYDKARAFLSTDNPAQFLYNHYTSAGDHTNPVNLTWTFNNPTGPFILQIAYDSEFQDICRTYNFSSKSIKSMEVYNLAPGRYFYRIVGGDYTCKADSFIVKGQLRTINTGDGIPNMRDLGGYLTNLDKPIKYGLIYHSANWNNANNISNSRLKELGIKTELDIRYDHTESEHPIDGINFVNYGMGQYTGVVPGGYRYAPQSNANIGNIFDFLADRNNYPMVYHCTAGADRTGTLSFLILGLLGVEYEEICRDFELTSLYYQRRWRSNIEFVDGVYSYTSNGIMQDDAYNYVGFNNLYQTMMNSFGGNKKTLSEAIENYLVNSCGVSTESINNVKNILTD